MDNTLKKHKAFWSNRSFMTSAFFGLALFALSLAANFLSTAYATKSASNYVEDLIVSRLPVFNVSFIVNEGVLLFIIFVLAIFLVEPRRIPFTLKSMALFIFIRSIFVTLTHLGPFPERTFIDPTDWLQSLNSGDDFFFSGHTGLPFLVALIFWKDRLIRYVSLAVSGVFGVSVLLGHLHYSIDVFSAFFITYGIFHISRRFFKKDYELIFSEAQ